MMYHEHSILDYHLIEVESEQAVFCRNLLSYIILREKHDFSKLIKVEPKMSMQ
jgi:hypothetical protein